MSIPSPIISEMQSWVITGGIACGKSTVLSRLQESLGAKKLAVYSCDEEVRRLLGLPAIQEAIKVRIGPGVVENGEVNREKLGKLVFEDLKARKELEAILHPPVLAALEGARGAAREAGTVNLFVAEVPLHYEIGGTVAADHVIVVASSLDQQVRRLMHYRGLDKARSESMVGAQWPVLEKANKATKVIWNDGSEEALDDQISILLSAFDP
jgi:dephospho-CoA kinase